ncbi:MAG: hypothetical protein OXE02_02365 [Chloroflexi bacterium]|nr:hypothetical protein [Chloroflexota bacterium]
MNEATNAGGQKAERFRRVAERRVNNVLEAVRLLSQCSNRRTYEYTDDDVRRMFREIDRELRAAKQSFSSVDKKKGFSF